MNWPWKNEKGKHVPISTEPDSDAQRAIERARLAQREADIHLVEIRERAMRARNERQQNHFGPLIWKAMGGK